MGDSKIETKKLLTKRQKKFVKKVLETGSFSRAALEAGYANREYGIVLKNKEEIRQAILGSLAKEGITSDLIAKKIREGLEATTPKKYSSRGTLLQDEAPDHFARNMYLDKVLKISGVTTQPEKVEVDQSKNVIIMMSPDLIKALVDAGAIDAEVIKEIPEIAKEEDNG